MLDLEIDDGLAVLTINRPHARNAIALDTMEQLEKALDAAAGAKALVITGAGDRAFVSGGDLKELSSLRTEEDATAMAKRTASKRIGPTRTAVPTVAQRRISSLVVSNRLHADSTRCCATRTSYRSMCR